MSKAVQVQYRDGIISTMGAAEVVEFDEIRAEVEVERTESVLGWGEYTALYSAEDGTYYLVTEDYA